MWGDMMRLLPGESGEHVDIVLLPSLPLLLPHLGGGEEDRGGGEQRGEEGRRNSPREEHLISMRNSRGDFGPCTRQLLRQVRRPGGR